MYKIYKALYGTNVPPFLGSWNSHWFIDQFPQMWALSTCQLYSAFRSRRTLKHLDLSLISVRVELFFLVAQKGFPLASCRAEPSIRCWAKIHSWSTSYEKAFCWSLNQILTKSHICCIDPSCWWSSTIKHIPNAWWYHQFYSITIIIDYH